MSTKHACLTIYFSLQVPKIGGSNGGSGGIKKEASIPADLAKRPEITITPIPRSLNEAAVAAAAVAAASNNPLSGLLGTSASGFPSSSAAALKSLGMDFSGLDMVTLNRLADVAKTCGTGDKGNLFDAMAAAAAVSTEPATKRFKAEHTRNSTDSSNTRLNGAVMDGTMFHSSQTPSQRSSHSHSQIPSLPPDLSKQLPSVPDLVSAELFRSMNLLDNNSKLLLPAHQSSKTMNALAALLPQTSIFPAPAAHQHHSTSPLKTQPVQTDIQRTDPPRVFQSPNIYAQGSRVYDKPTADVISLSPKRSTPTREQQREQLQQQHHSKSSSPEIQILDLSQPPSSGFIGSVGGSNKNGKHFNKNDNRLDVELLDLSARRDITVSAVPKSKHSKGSSHHMKGEGVTITANNTRSYRGVGGGGGASGSGGAGGLGGSLSGGLPGDLSSLVSGMPSGMASVIALAAAAAASQPSSSTNSLAASLGLVGAAGGGTPNATAAANSQSAAASLLPFLIGASAGAPPPASPNTSNKSSSSSLAPPPPSMFSPYLDPSNSPLSVAAYYSQLLPPSLLGGSPPSASHAALQMAQLNSLGLPPISPTTDAANLGMYKNFLTGGASASASPSVSAASSASGVPAPHFLAALMSSPGTPKPKK